MSALLRGLAAAQAKARGFVDPGLSPEGLQSKRDKLDAAARAEFAPRLEALRAEVTSDVAAAATKGAAALPKFGSDAAAIAQSQRAWDKTRLRLDAGMPLHAVLAGADVETALAVREWGPAWIEAQTYRAAAGRGSGTPSIPDHAPLLRSVDTRLAELTGPTAVAALSAARVAAGVGAFVNVHADHLANVIGDSHISALSTGVALGAEYAEVAARDGLPEYETSDNSPATPSRLLEGVTAE